MPNGAASGLGSIEHVSAILDHDRFSKGPLRFEKLEVTKLMVVLEPRSERAG